MAFIVEDGTGKTTATSYLSVADADTYINVYTTRTTWTTTTDDEKETALMRATQYLDNKYGGRYKGTRASEDQALMWPRGYAYDLSGYLLASDELNSYLTNATAEMADRIQDGDDPIADQEDAAKIQSSEIKVGPIEEKTSYVGGGMTLGKVYPNVEAILKPILESNTIIKLERA